MEITYHNTRIDYDEERKLGTILTLANGKIGVRGELELIPIDSCTLISGVYSDVPIFHRDIVCLPRTVGVYIIVDGTPLNLVDEGFELKRTLDIRTGVVKTKLTWSKGKSLIYESTRLVHKVRKNIIAVNSRIRPQGFQGEITLILPLEFASSNPLPPGNISIKHYRICKVKECDDTIVTDIETLDDKYGITIALKSVTNTQCKRQIIRFPHSIGEALSFKVMGDNVYEVTKFISIVSSRDDPYYHEKALRELQSAIQLGWDNLYREHAEWWRNAWNKLNLHVDGDEGVERALYFNAFHLLQLGDEDSEYCMIPARGLHGVGYRGHIFWDADIYTLPFYTLVNPVIARKMLTYRYRLLKAARKMAKERGYRGAMYPWEAADVDYDVTPDKVPLDIKWEKWIKIWTGEEEQHITADIAYAVDFYYQYTLDDEFMEKYGLEIIFETARFWACRVEYDKDRGKYVIRRVTGPDEYHVHVDNNFYTNIMAKWNLLLGVKYYNLALERNEWKKIVSKLGVSKREVETWCTIASKIYIPCSSDGLYEQFEGYSNLEDYTINSLECLGQECLPESVRNRLEKTKIIKQADVVMAFHLLGDLFRKEDMLRNFNYYLPRTTHESSLSLSIYASVAARLGLTSLAYKLFKKAVNIDLQDIYGNTRDGIHVASAGGAWCSFLFGFLGLKVHNDNLTLDPKIPKHWRKVSINVVFRGELKNIKVE